MRLVNFDDARSQIESCGILLDKDLVFDSSFQRWKVSGEDNERRGWTRLTEWQAKSGDTYVVGAFGVWHGSDDGKQTIALPKKNADKPPLSDEDLVSLKEAVKEAQRKIAEQRKAEAKRAAQWSSTVWSCCAPCIEHEYLARKNIHPHGARILGDLSSCLLPGLDEPNRLRLDKAKGALVVPMHDTNGNVCGIQLIYPRGHARSEAIGRDKEFWPKGMSMGGTFGMIGAIRRDGILLIAEGFATAASLAEATGQSVAYAFSANNLSKSGKLIRKAYPRVKILFCADDDYLSEGNPGVTYASRATAEIEGSQWLKPDFTGDDGSDRREGKKLTDFNDLFILTGVSLTLANQVNAKLEALKWSDAGRGARGTPLAGGGGGETGRRKRAASVMGLDEAVDRFVPLDDGRGSALFDHWTNRVVLRDQMIAVLPSGIRWDDVKRHPVWIERGACYLDQVGFDPSGEDQSVLLNTWGGWPMEPKPGKCELMLELLAYLCSEEANAEEVRHWLTCWLAWPLQHPGAKMNSAVIMHGPQGVGKSMIFQAIAEIYGDYATVLNQRGLEDKFNADWVDSKLFLLAEEVVTRREMWQIKNELKEIVTGRWIRVNPKNIAAYRQKNQINVAYLSNENQPQPLENDDRRHLVVHTPPMLSGDFYQNVVEEMEAGGIAAFYHYLIGYDTAGFHPKKRPPMTEAKERLITLSLPSELRFLREWASGELGLPVCPCLSADLYATYQRWCRDNGEAHPRPSNHFYGAIENAQGWSKKKQRIYPNIGATQSVPKPIVIPPIDILQADGSEKPPEMPHIQWLSESVRRYADALAELLKAGEKVAA